MVYGSENLIIKQKLEDAIEYSYCVFRHFPKAEMILIVEILLSVAIAGLIHELGHYLAALTFGHHLVFRRQAFRFPLVFENLDADAG